MADMKLKEVSKEVTSLDVNVFEILNSINVNDKIEKKNGLTYLSWAYAWGEVKKIFPKANYTVYERDTDYGLVNYFTDGNTCWVKTGVTIEELEHVEELPIMDLKNKSIKLENVTSFDVNKAIQRSLTKALARHGLGLYIYAGEDLPNDESAEKDNSQVKHKTNDKQMIDEGIRYTQLRTKLTQLGVNFRDDNVTVEFICKKANIATQDIEMLNIDSLIRLNDVYEGIIANKEKKQNAK